jgi:hypothetical protein
MYYGENQSSEDFYGRSVQYALLNASLNTGSGEANLEDAPQTHQVVVARENPVSTAYFNPNGPMAFEMPYIQPQFQYSQASQPVQAPSTSRNKLTENVTVNEE